MKINNNLILVFACLLAVSCSLDYDPLGAYSDVTEGSSASEDKPIYVDRLAVLNARTSLMRRYRSGPEHWYDDWLLLGDVHSDNAYYGTYGNETIPFANNSIEGSNINLSRDWTQHMGNIARANTFIEGVDQYRLSDITDAEKRQFKAEGKIFRAMVYFDMIRIWGRVPLITTVAGEITSETVVDIYPFYYPAQAEELEVYQQIEEDLIEGVQYALNNDPGDKTLLSKSVARALLAKMYIQEPLRNYDKVIQYANELEADGFVLTESLEDLFGVVLADPNQPPGPDNLAIDGLRNNVESIYEAQFMPGSATWLAMMWGRILDDWHANFTWAKWCTPTRNLISEYNSEGVGKDKRYASTVVWYSCNWSIHYPSDNYAFMYKFRSNFSSMIKIRYADILLLKAEALIGKGDYANAAAVVNLTRQRAGLDPLPASASANKESIMNAYMKERRLELALEGERWHDLVRWGLVEDVMNAAYTKDPDRIPLVYPYEQYSYKLPIPATAIDQNPNLVQNPGY